MEQVYATWNCRFHLVIDGKLRGAPHLAPIRPLRLDHLAGSLEARANDDVYGCVIYTDIGPAAFALHVVVSRRLRSYR